MPRWGETPLSRLPPKTLRIKIPPNSNLITNETLFNSKPPPSFPMQEPFKKPSLHLYIGPIDSTIEIIDSVRPLTQSKLKLMKAIHLNVIILLTALTLAACKHRAQNAPDTALIGTYELVEVNGQIIPAEVSHGSTPIRVEAGQIEFNAKGSCISRTVFGPPKGENIHREVRANCTFDGQLVTMAWHGAGHTQGQFEQGGFTMNNEGMLFRYRKISSIE